MSRRRDRIFELVQRLGEDAPLEHPEAFLVVSPLRVCPLGAHVDHLGGVVTGMTIDREVLLAVAPDSKPVISVASLDFPGEVEVRLGDPVPSRV